VREVEDGAESGRGRIPWESLRAGRHALFPNKSEMCYPQHTMRLLFVCTANIDRSPTGEKLFRGEHETKSCGTAPWSRMKLNRRLIWWADRIFCMEDHHRQAVLEIDPEAEKKTFVLGIEDAYRRGNHELEELLKEKVRECLSAC